MDADGPGPKVYVPSNAGQFTALGITVPNFLWLCQEAAGNLADSIGAMILTANGTPHYQQAVAGWTRKAATLDDASNDRFQAGAGVGPNPAATSVLFIAYIDMTTTPGATRKMWGVNSGNPIAAQVTSIPNLRGVCVGNSDAGANSPVNGGVKPIIVQLNRTAGVALVADSTTKLLPTYSGAVTDANKGLGGNAAGDSMGCAMVYGFGYSGVNAELTSPQLKTLLQKLRWPIKWS